MTDNKYYTEVAGEKLVSNIRDFILSLAKYKHTKLPWDVLPQEQQEKFISEVEQASENFAKDIVRVIDTHNRKAIPIKVESITIKNGIKGQIIITNDKDLLDFVDYKDTNGYLTWSSFGCFDQERDSVDIKPDQPEISGLITHQELDEGDHV